MGTRAATVAAAAPAVTAPSRSSLPPAVVLTIVCEARKMQAAVVAKMAPLSSAFMGRLRIRDSSLRQTSKQEATHGKRKPLTICGQTPKSKGRTRVIAKGRRVTKAKVDGGSRVAGVRVVLRGGGGSRVSG